MTDTKKSSKTAAATAEKAEKYDGFTEGERGAMKDRAKELKAATGRGSKAAKADPEAEVLAKIAELPDEDRVLAEWLHGIVKENAPELAPKLWYGMPAYARDGKLICFFQSAQKFKSRYATLGFSDQANLDEGAVWPTYFALAKKTSAAETQVVKLIKQALS